MRLAFLGSVVLLVVAFCCATAANATVIIYQDTFSGTPGTALGGHAPDIASGLYGGTLNAQWTDNSGSMHIRRGRFIPRDRRYDCYGRQPPVHHRQHARVYVYPSSDGDRPLPPLATG